MRATCWTSSSARFDHVVAMDSLIHYSLPDMVGMLARLAEMSRSGIHFTYAPRTPALAAMHIVGKVFPRSDRSPRIVPHATASLYKRHHACRRACGDWRPRPQRPRLQRLLHFPCAGAEARMRKLNQAIVKGWQETGSPLPALRRCRDHGSALGPPAAAVAVPGLGRHGHGAADRHAEPRDDRRTGRSRLARRA